MMMKITEKFGRSYFLEQYYKLKTICPSDFQLKGVLGRGLTNVNII